jgi:serine/threonine protein kinase
MCSVYLTMTWTWTGFAVSIVRELVSSLSGGGHTGPERVCSTPSYSGNSDAYTYLPELAPQPFEWYLKSNILVDYRELTGDDTIDLTNLLQQMLVLDPKQRSTVHQILGHKWLNPM